MKPLLLSIAIILAVATVAEAAKFRGQTSQDRRAVVVTDDNDLPVRITIVWRARCDEGHITDDTSFLPPYRERSETFVRDGGPYTTTVRDDRGREYKVHAKARVRARRVTARKWRGRFRLSAEVRRNGRFVTECRTGRIRWRATL
jgi:hypothetical protein